VHTLILLHALHQMACDAACHSRRVNSRAMHADWHKAMADFGKGGGLVGYAVGFTIAFVVVYPIGKVLGRWIGR
jgi:hypothetical protein